MSDRPTFDVSGSIVGGGLSLLFWTSLAASGALFGLLVLAPRILEQEYLQVRHYRNNAAIKKIQGEISHLDKVAKALKTDSDFIARVAKSERILPSDSVTRLPISPELAFDPRVPTTEAPATLSTPLRRSALARALGAPSRLRTHCTIAAAMMLVTAFVCFHEGFLLSQLGFVLAPWDWVKNRYASRRHNSPR